MKLSGSDILFILFVGPLPPGMFKTKPPPEPTLEALEVPTTDIGTPLPVLFGTKRLTNPKVAWYGNLSIKKVKTDTAGKK